MKTIGFYKKIFFLSLFLATLPLAKNQNHFSDKFVNTPYEANTLIGYSNTEEKLVIRTDKFDCFTFIDMIEASKSHKPIEDAIKTIRYKNSQVKYTNRNHFFSDWTIYNSHIKDVTCQIGICYKTLKNLNQKSKNEVYLQGIAIIQREIYYTKPENLDYTKLQNGDYIGIYTPKNGLDVTHVGIAIQKENIWYLRHASSKEKKVIDSNLKEYIKNKDGIVIYRSDI